MNNNKEFKILKDNYMNIEIPDNLDKVVNDALNSKSIKTKRKTISKWSSVSASVCLVVGAINLSPAFANTLEEIPVIGNVIKIINFRNYSIDENGFDVSIAIPKIEGLKNKDLEYRLNKDFEEDGKRLYQEYLKEMETLKSEGVEGRELVKSWYEVKTDNDDILSLVVSNHYVQGSSNTTRKFYNINKKDQTVLTLEGMFAGNDYVNIISENIKEQMREKMKENPNEHYWLDEDMEGLNFTKINKDQGFYINDNNGNERRLSNGPMEGYNRTPKDFKRNSRGLSNFEYVRSRLIWANRKNESILAIPKSKKEVYKFKK